MTETIPLPPDVAALLDEGRRRKAQADQEAAAVARIETLRQQTLDEAHWAALVDTIARDLPGQLVPYAGLDDVPEWFHGRAGADPRDPITLTYDLEIRLPGCAPICRHYEYGPTDEPAWRSRPWPHDSSPWAVCRWHIYREWSCDQPRVEPLSLPRWTYCDDLLVALAVAEESERERLTMESQIAEEADEEAHPAEPDHDTGMALLHALEDHFTWLRYERTSPDSDLSEEDIP